MPRQPNSGARRTGGDLFGNAHGTNGKGDRDRTSDRERFTARIHELDLPGKVEGLNYVGGGRYRKVY